uniref:CHK domain-containing protein n=1 Tax=Panagrellus redivivus TaxID=6233 RepID=A0A7E4UVR4_PANRE
MEKWSPLSKLSDSSVTGEVFINDLRKAGELDGIEEKFRIVNIAAVHISEGKGYLSKVYRCDVTFEPLSGVNEAPPSLSVALKQPCSTAMDAVFNDKNETPEMREKAKGALDHFHDMIKKFHNHECTFYNIFSNSGLPLPKLYGSSEWDENNEGYLLFEYVKNGKFMALDEGLTLGQAKSLLKFIAKMQAVGYQKKKLWENKFTRPDFGNSDADVGGSIMEKVGKGGSEAFKKLHRRFGKFYTDHDTVKFASGDKWFDFGLPTALTHGDMWSSNLNFKTGVQSDEINAIIDWQVVHDGNPMIDVSRILLVCCDSDVRRALEPTVCQFLYDEVKQALGHAPPYSIDDLVISKRYADLSSLFFAMFLPGVHFHNDDDETQAKKARFMQRLEDLMEDQISIIEEHFPTLLVD